VSTTEELLGRKSSGSGPECREHGRTVQYSKVHTSEHFSHNFPIQNGLKQGDALSPMLFNFTLEYVVRKIQEKQVGLKLIGAHHSLVYVDDVNLLADNIDTMRRAQNCDVSMEAHLEVNSEKTVYMLLSLTGMKGNITT
jgi:hypothetical protein